MLLRDTESTPRINMLNSSILVLFFELYVDLKELCELPSRSVVTENQSKAMRDFEDVRVILDCTEILK
jgi:hypothetical protein